MFRMMIVERNNPMSRYQPLQQYLASQQAGITEVTLTFAEIEQILQASLPPSAHKYACWWANPRTKRQHPHAQSWLAVGWRVRGLSIDGAWVRFQRK